MAGTLSEQNMSYGNYENVKSLASIAITKRISKYVLCQTYFSINTN
jgi:hypothetical protein